MKSSPENTTGWCCPAAVLPNILRNRPEGGGDRSPFLEAGKPIAANCHGPLLLLAAGDMKGRRMTCYPDLEPDLRSAGCRVS